MQDVHRRCAEVDVRNRQPHWKAVMTLLSRIFGEETVVSVFTFRREQREDDVCSDHQKANINYLCPRVGCKSRWTPN